MTRMGGTISAWLVESECVCLERASALYARLLRVKESAMHRALETSIFDYPVLRGERADRKWLAGKEAGRQDLAGSV